ncbi:MAG: tail fiber domain-containing protein [Flavobacteriales bacterium]|nr:tail fiber domain-containing protein [Flavobacteriales bacterium]
MWLTIATVQAQTITQGAAGSVFQQLDNSFVNPQDWTRSLGVGYFWPNGAVPESFLHVDSRFSVLPMNGSIASLSETFRTRVAAGQNQFWRMERGQLEIGNLYHGNPGNAFQIKAMQADGNLWLRNSVDNGFRIHFDGAFNLNTFNGDRVGFASLGSQPGMNAFSTPAPWTRLHLAHEQPGANLPEFGYRGWERNGIALTGQSDFAYIGQKYHMGASGDGPEEDDNTDLVIAVGDEGLPEQDASTHNNISFRFLGANGVDGSAGTIEGLEMMRLRPYRATANAPIIGRVGVGDFVNNATLPEESLDILEGKVRVRDLPTDPLSTSEEVVTVNMTNGNLEHRPLGALPDNCEWKQVIGTAYADDVYTGIGTFSGCPDRDNSVGIGTALADAKLHVAGDVLADPIPRKAILAVLKGDATSNWNNAIESSITPSGSSGAYFSGLTAQSYNAITLNAGVVGRAFNNTGLTVAEMNGVRAEAEATNGSVTNAYGIFANSRKQLAGSITNNHGGRFWAQGGGSVVGALVTAELGSTLNIGVNSFATSAPTSTAVQGNASCSGIASSLVAGGRFTGTSSVAGTVWGGRLVGSGNSATANIYGAECQGIGGGAGSVYGVRASALGGAFNYGLYASVADTSANNWAGFLVGKLRVSSNVHAFGYYSLSDASLKTNVQELQNAGGIIAQLNPYTYEFLPSTHPNLMPPSGPQLGLIAQELEDVLPQLVVSVTDPAVVDSAGVEIAPAVTYKAVNYVCLIPVLIANAKEQQVTISSLQDQVASMQQDLAACCASQGTDDQRSMSTAASMDVKHTDLFIIPNPVADLTQLRYTIATPGRTRLEVADGQGKRLEILEEAVREVGMFEYGWNTQDLAPGTYHCTLFVNNTFVVKKAVKVGAR